MLLGRPRRAGWSCGCTPTSSRPAPACSSPSSSTPPAPTTARTSPTPTSTRWPAGDTVATLLPGVEFSTRSPYPGRPPAAGRRRDGRAGHRLQSGQLLHVVHAVLHRPRRAGDGDDPGRGAVGGDRRRGGRAAPRRRRAPAGGRAGRPRRARRAVLPATSPTGRACRWPGPSSCPATDRRQAPAALSTCTWKLAPSSDSHPFSRAPATMASHRSAQSGAVARLLGGGAQGSRVEERGVGVLDAAQPGAFEHLGGLLVGDLPEGEVQPGEVVDVDDPRLGALLRASHHLDDHRGSPSRCACRPLGTRQSTEKRGGSRGPPGGGAQQRPGELPGRRPAR